MGLFDFAANMGHKLFTSKDGAASVIKEAIESDNPCVKNLGVEFTMVS